MASLLNNASLLLNPAGSIIAYEEDKIFSVLPSNGAGDFTFSGGDGGTRVNQQGYIEPTPGNIFSYSEDFNNAFWSKYQVSVTDNAIANPINGLVTADRLDPVGSTTNNVIYKYTIPNTNPSIYTLSCYFKLGAVGTTAILALYGATSTGSWAARVLYDLSTGTLTNQVTTNLIDSGMEYIKDGWYRCWVTARNDYDYIYVDMGYDLGSGGYAYMFGAQYNFGSLRPYQPTTDRLNYPRITYQNGRGALLSEPQRTNLNLYSQGFDNAYWNKQNASITASAGISPDGTNNAFKLNANTNAAFHLIFIGGLYNGQVAVSVFAKKGEYDFLYIRIDEPSTTTTYFNLANGTVGTVGSGHTAYIEPYKDGWYRCTTVFSKNIVNYCLGVTNADNSATPILETNKGIYIWGSQVEAGSFPTSYIPTTSATVTRPIDNANRTGISSLIGQTEGVIYFKGTVNNSVNAFTNIITSERNTNSSFFFARISSNGQIDAGLFSNGSDVGRITAGNVPNGQLSKIAYAYKSGDSALFINGVQAGSTNTGTFTLPNTLDDVFLDDPNIYFGYPESINFNTAALFNSRLTNTQLAELTTVRSGSGGNISYYGPYTVHTFTGSATFTPSFTGQVEVLVVAGGGAGGGGDVGGGGGAGGLLYASSYGVSQGTGITVTIGAGGTGVAIAGAAGGNGSNSVFGGLTAIGGGGGAGWTKGTGSDGGSGGGSTWYGVGGKGIPGQGNDGGTGGVLGPPYPQCGGGGAGEAGFPAQSSTVAGNGGDGLPYSISGFSTYYAGGGGGATEGSPGSTGTPGIGGLGGGGNGGSQGAGTLGTPGVNYTGGGGGGCDPQAGANGGSGVVIVRYLT